MTVSRLGLFETLTPNDWPVVGSAPRPGDWGKRDSADHLLTVISVTPYLETSNKLSDVREPDYAAAARRNRPRRRGQELPGRRGSVPRVPAGAAHVVRHVHAAAGRAR